jgi:hypothetical protein
MKKITKILIALIFLIISTCFQNAFSQIVFDGGWIPDSIAYVDIGYTETAVAVTPPSRLPITYSLVKALDGMLINQNTGVITWTPNNIADGGKVIVKAKNNANESVTKEYFIYVSNAIPCPENLEAYWKLDEESGPTYYDWIGTNNAFATVNSPKDTTGIVDIAQEFDPANKEGLSVPSDAVFDWGVDEDFSIELWFRNKVNRIDSISIMIGRNEGDGATLVHWWIGYFSDSTIFFIIRENATDAAVCQSSKIHDTEWHYVAAVRNASANKIYLYIDGLQVDDDDYDGSGPGFVTTVPVNIGWLEPHGTVGQRYPFNGSIDELRIHGKALSPAEVAVSYAKSKNGNPACRDGNFAPLLKSATVDTAFEDQPYSYQIVASDPDVGDIINYSIEFKPAWLNYNSGTKTFNGTPGNSEVGDHIILITLNDSKDTVQQEFTLRVINVNDDPVITSSPQLTVNEDNPYSYQIIATDIDAGDILTYSAPAKPAWLSINSSSGLLSGTPPLNDTSEYNITLRVTDKSAAYDEQSFTLDILNINDPPVITGQPTLAIDEDHSILIELDDIYYTDVDNGPSDLTLTVKNGSNYTHVGNLIIPLSNYHGALNVPIELSDLEYTDTETLTITVNSINDIPVITSLPNLTAFENQQYIYLFTAEDNDVEDNLVFASVKIPDWLLFNSGNQVLSGKPDFFDVGEDSVVLTVTDGKVTIYNRFLIEVMATNNIPRITSSPSNSVNEDSHYSYTITYTDADPGDIVVLSGVIIPGWLTLNENVLSGTPTNDQVGTEPSVPYTVKLRVSDGKQDSTQTFTVTVKNVNDAPVITGQPDTILAYAGSKLVIKLSDITVEDVDNNPDDLTIILLPGSNYTISGDTAKINSGAKGIININMRVSDGKLQSSTYAAYARVYGGTGIHEIEKTNNLIAKLYPVPASEFLMFEIEPGNTVLNLELITIQGQTVIQKEITSDEKIIKLDTNTLPSGIYIYKLYNNKLFQTGSVAIQK